MTPVRLRLNVGQPIAPADADVAGHAGGEGDNLVADRVATGHLPHSACLKVSAAPAARSLIHIKLLGSMVRIVRAWLRRAWGFRQGD